MTTPPTDRRAELLARRERLYREQAEHEARLKRQKEIDDFRRFRGALLEREGITHQLIWPEDNVPKGPMSTYPIGFASVHWDLVPHAVWDFAQRPYRQPCLKSAFLALGVGPETEVVLDLCTGGEPRVLLPAGALQTHEEELIGSEGWIYQFDHTWLIEVYHEGDITYADRPGAPEHAGDLWRPPKRKPHTPRP